MLQKPMEVSKESLEVGFAADGVEGRCKEGGSRVDGLEPELRPRERRINREDCERTYHLVSDP
jgi:hypothetical protein